MNVNVFIPSKGRAGKARTIQQLIEIEMPFTLIVEPQDAEAYQAAYPNAPHVTLHIMPENSKGITYVRNHILQYAREIGLKNFWMIDDDLNFVGLVENKKVHKSDYKTVLSGAQKELEKIENLCIGGLEYQQFAWSATKPLAFNSYAETCVFVNLANMANFKYRDNIKEDRDMVLQTLQAGYVSARTTQFCFSNPKNGSNEGGLHEEYKSGKEALWSQRMMALWPGVCTPSPKTDRVDVKINWRVFKGNIPVYKS